MINKAILGVALGFFFLLALPVYASLTSSCQPIYGGGINCQTNDNLTLDVKVQKPGTSSYVDLLSQNESYYSSTVNFLISVKNISKRKISKVEIVDKIPSGFSFLSGPGSYDSNNNTLTLELKDIERDQTKSLTISLKSNKNDRSLECFANYVEIKSGRNKADDNARFCVGQLAASPTPGSQNQVQTAPNLNQTPGTGPELVGLISLASAAAAGLFLVKRSS